jgi:mRNA-degrading endonuclease toxin of MazEF toxin-antitoxin module
VVVSHTAVTEDQRFPLLAVVPISSTAGEGAFYPALEPGRSGLRRRSYALVDQVRSIDKRRIGRVFGKLADGEIAAIDEGLILFLGLG